MSAAEYGCDELGRLRRVMLHRPGRSLELIDGRNCGHWLFDAVPEKEAFLDEHNAYRALLESLGVDVVELSRLVEDEAEVIERMPNLTYLHDTAVITRRGAVISAMCRARIGEQYVVRKALERLGIPVFYDFRESEDAFEGFLLLSPETVLVAVTERHSYPSVSRFTRHLLHHFAEILVVDIPKARRFMHPDTIYNRIDHDLALGYLPVLQNGTLYRGHTARQVNPLAHLRQKGITVLGVSDSEQRRLACSFVVLEPRVMLHYDTALDPATQRALARKGVELITFHPRALCAGGGSLRCLTLRLHRSRPTKEAYARPGAIEPERCGAAGAGRGVA